MEDANSNMGRVNAVFLAIAVIAALVLYNSAYVIDETEQVVITQFGRIMGDAKKTPGLKFKVPFIQKVNYFPKNLLEWDGDPGQIPTKDKTYIWVDTFARWRISDPVVYFQTVKDEFSALKRLDDIIDPAMRDLISAYPLVESVRNTDRPMDTFDAIRGLEAKEGEDTPKRMVRYRVDLGRAEIARQIEKQAREKLADFGIQIVDVKIKRINYIDSVRGSVYNRMVAERNQIAEKFRAEGQGEASNIRGEKEKELQVIKSQAYKQAQEIKGKADAQATRIYSAAYGQDPEFYAFVKTMELYTKTLDKDSTVILSTESELMKYFKKSSD
ncbi:MAG TPA: protease modulator HflC [Desulfobacter postgatei]|jgi:membrane protease subunit HflC|uniref:protease modulator HflC n=1 Tax=unclassified Desulfobacter TaxID=2634406 RepID=UPI001B4BC5F9|nr:MULTISPECIES: protease modulator HflC [unclassified Desulfobacter]MBP8829008.1 protease modulator HflC [Desulfobacter sp.]MBP9598069.1 protease modulator HflC [Desulfobacter sp.]MDQ1270965.1 modulator of FtsH protease HflC [Thermodesulfobacteriota bacterium]HRF90012.1 protease modulator HflC [Desulfobacter postgatei]